MLKKTKIVCTLGPATNTLDAISKLAKTGMDVCRLNFSHGDHDSHRKVFETIKKASKKLGKDLTILQDLQGPKIRVGDLPKDGVRLTNGRQAIFSTDPKPKEGDIPVTLPSLHLDVKADEHLLFDDGLLEVIVDQVLVKERRIVTTVLHGGILFPHKGLNLPGTKLSIPALSAKDRSDAIFGARLGVDYIALSFVRSAQDVKDLRKLLDQQGEQGRQIGIIAKIEKQEAVDNFDKILPFCDAIMVARGDLGVEIPAQNVPVIQKHLITKCHAAGKPVIVATQMLDSMQRNPRPTRAEVSDIANAVQDQADAVMLSGETASGAYPIESVKMMCDTILSMEQSDLTSTNNLTVPACTNVDQALAASVRLLSDALCEAPAFVLTSRGRMAREISAMRLKAPTYAYTFSTHTARLLSLVWGIQPMVIKKAPTFLTQANFVLKDAKKRKLVKAKQQVIVVAGGKAFPRDASHRADVMVVT